MKKTLVRWLFAPIDGWELAYQIIAWGLILGPLIALDWWQAWSCSH